MRVREHDRGWLYAFQFSKPIKSAIDHHGCTAIRYQQRGVHPMSPRPRINFTACAEEGQVHRDTLERFYKCCSHRPVAGPIGRAGSPLPAAWDPQYRRARSDAPYLLTAHRAVATAAALI